MNERYRKGDPIDGEYFHRTLLFLNIDDFFSNRATIKNRLLIEDVHTVYYYRLYVYSRPFVSDMWKDYIWDYVMGDMKDEDFVYAYVIHRKRPN